MINIKYNWLLICVSVGLVKATPAFCQFPSDTNFTESRVIAYQLPDPLLMANGKKVKNREQWIKTRRPYVYRLFEKNVYGRYPRQAVRIRYRIRETDHNALGGIATRKQIRIFLKPNDTTVYVDVLMYLPRSAAKPVPVFLGLNFRGNATVQPDPAIFLSSHLAFPHFKQRNDDADRGKDASSWPVKEILSQGFGVVTACDGDLEEDHAGGWKTGIRTTMAGDLRIKPSEWGAIGAWAWGLSRIMDYLETDKDVNPKEVAVIGHSRLGKTALWAGASDPRFNMVISNESGEGGAALARRWYGETVKFINERFPYWFVDRYKKYNNAVDSLPVDQHELLALIAPRSLYVASAAGDKWSDPKGEFLSAVNAGPVYALFGKEGLGTREMPPLFHPVGHRIHYHIRKGKHGITLYDWQQYLRFAKEQWKLR
jgi:hypothetical protein